MTIVAAIDAESTPDPVIAAGIELANGFDEEFVALHVMPTTRFERIRESVGGPGSAGPGSFPLYEGYVDRIRQQTAEPNPYSIDVAQDDAASAAREVVEDTMGEDYRGVDVQGRVGSPADEIVAEADRRDARYLVIGGRKRTPVGKAVFGSVTQSVLLNANQPVLTVPEDGMVASAGGPVVAAIDRSERVPAVVEHGSMLAAALDRSLHVVHALKRGEYAELESAEGSDRSAIGEDDVRRAAADVVRELVDDVADDYQAVGLVGDASEAVIDYAHEHDAGFLVLAGRRRSPVGKVLFGSVTQSVLLSAERPVLNVMGED